MQKGRLTRLRGFEGVAMRKCLEIKPATQKVFTTAAQLASAPAAVIFGGGCSGNCNFNWLSNS
jgi:hypothetical protein